MKKTGMLICMIVFCVSFIWVGVTHAAPQMEFVEGTTFDFGNVQANARLNHIFVFKNIGDEVLHIKNVKGG